MLAAPDPIVSPLAVSRGSRERQDPHAEPNLRNGLDGPVEVRQFSVAIGAAMTTSAPDHHALAQALRNRVVDGRGVADHAIRKAAADRAAGGPAVAAPYDDLASRIGQCSHRVTDEQVKAVVQAAGSEKAAFEIIAAAAMGAGLMRWQLAIKALEEASDASAGN